eukprot:5595940-Pyramimonas_sp.AAC.1
MQTEGAVPMLMKHITQGSPLEKKWAAESLEILMGNEEYRRALVEGPLEAVAVIASLLLNAQNDKTHGSVMDCAGRMLCTIYQDRTTCHAQSPTKPKLHSMQ